MALTFGKESVASCQWLRWVVRVTLASLNRDHSRGQGEPPLLSVELPSCAEAGRPAGRHPSGSWRRWAQRTPWGPLALGGGGIILPIGSIHPSDCPPTTIPGAQTRGCLRRGQPMQPGPGRCGQQWPLGLGRRGQPCSVASVWLGFPPVRVTGAGAEGAWGELRPSILRAFRVAVFKTPGWSC